MKAERPDRVAEVRVRVHDRLVEALGPKLFDADLSEKELQELVHERLRELLEQDEMPLTAQERVQIIRQIGDSILGLGPLEPLVQDPDVSEIMVNGPETVYVERNGRLYWTG